MFKHLLIAHDLRDTADLALARAAQLARQHQARLTVLHVQSPGQTQAQREQAERTLDQSLSRLAPAGTQLQVQTGKAWELILAEVQNSACDLLVLGGHQQRHELFSDTSLDRIARRCSVPLLLVAHTQVQPYQRALAAIDFSLCACSALNYGYRLLPSAASLHALHVFEADKGTPAEVQAQLQTQQALIDQLLHDEALQLPPDGARLSHEVIQGGILRALQEQVKKRRTELLVLGSHGRGAFSQALLGSLAQHFLHKAPCDVLVVR